MDRRTFLGTLTGGLLVAPLAAEAQQPGRVFRIGILAMTSPQTPRVRLLEHSEGLRDLGYVEGQNITIVHRSSEGKFQRLPDLAAELVRLKVDVSSRQTSQNVVVAKRCLGQSRSSWRVPAIRWGRGSSPALRGLAGT